MRTAAIFLLLSSAAAAQVTVSGTLRYEDQTYDGGGATGFTYRPIRLAEVELFSGGTTLALGATDAAGNYSFPGIAAGVSVQVRVYTRASTALMNAAIRNNLGANAVYAAVSAATVTAGPTTTIDLDLDRNGAGPVFNLFDCAVKSFTHLGVLGVVYGGGPPPMNVYWEPNSPNGTYFDGSVNGIFLLGTGADPDQYDDDIVLHEMGHWVAFHLSKDDTLGGPHSVIDQLDPRTSWSEGWAHYWSATVRRASAPEYAAPNLQVDLFGSGHSVFDIEGPSFPALAIMATNELAVAAVLWDITDPGAAEAFDPLSGNEPEVWQAFSGLTVRTNVTLEDFRAGLAAAAPGIIADVTGSETQPGIFKDRRVRYYDDGSEPNDGPGAAVALAPGPAGLALRTIFDAGDEDWYSVAATPGTLVIETLNLGDGADTQLDLYDATGALLLDSNDNVSPGDRSSRLTRSVGAVTTFLVRVLRSGSLVEHGYYDLRAQILVNGPPTIRSVSASSLAGFAPLRVTFRAEITDPDGGSHDHRWDFNGDGLLDWSSLQGATVTTTYDEPGIYAATYRLVDSGDSIASAAPLVIQVLSSATPAIFPSLTATSGAAPLTVAFDASVSGILPTAYLWDFDGDGLADAASVTDAASSFTYRLPGVYTPRLVVRDTFGRAHRVLTSPVTITAASPPDITTLTGTIDFLPMPSQFQLVTTSLTGSSIVEFDFDGDARVDLVVPPSSPSSTTVLQELHRAGPFTARVRITDAAGVSDEGQLAYTARTLGLAGWLVDPRDGDRLSGAVTLTAEAVPADRVKTVRFQRRDALGGPWIDIGAPITGAGSLVTTTWDTDGLADLSSFHLRILIDDTVSSGDTANTVVKDSVAPTLDERAGRRRKVLRTDRTTVSRNGAGVWVLVPVGATGDALPLEVGPAAAPQANGSALSRTPVGGAWSVGFSGSFQAPFQLRLPYSGDGSDLEVHRYDAPSGVWGRFGYPRVSHDDGWVEADVAAPGLYSLFRPAPAGSGGGNALCGALGVEGVLVLLLLRRIRRRC